MSVWGYKTIKGIRWLTKPKHHELAGAFLSVSLPESVDGAC